MAKDDLTVEEMLAAARKRNGVGGNSRLFLWMLENYDALAKDLNETQGVNWKAMADYVASKGIMDRTGKPPTKETVKNTWYKVRKRKNETAEQKPKRDTKSEPDKPKARPAFQRAKLKD